METSTLELPNENGYNHDLEKYEEREKLLQENIDGKSGEEISGFFDGSISTLIEAKGDAISKLIEIDADEKGGLVAITGFYYQMLVAIEYLIQMKQGRWDNIAIELHDDIVATKGKHIRFIQVKTSNKLTCIVTEKPASDLYLRSNKKIKEKDRDGKSSLKISNSWIDKLILKSKTFKKENNYKTEFELLTNYMILDSPTKKIGSYFSECIDKVIDIEDSIYKTLIEESYIKDDDLDEYIKVDYESMCGEKLEELLSRFYIKCKLNSLDNIKQYVDSICQTIAIEIGGKHINPREINWIIGELFSCCNVNAENRELVISKENVISLFLEIENRAMIALGKTYEESATSKIIESAYESIHNKYKNKTNYNAIERNILNYKEDLINWINLNGGINKVINRYISANEISNNHIGMDVDEKKDIMKELILIPIILKILYNTEVSYTDDKTLLTKDIKDNEIERISLLNVKHRSIKKIIPDIKQILSNLKFEDILKLTMSKELNLILQGYDDTEFLIKDRIEVNTLEEENQVFQNEMSIKKVHHIVGLIPGEAIKGKFSRELDEDDWDEEQLKKIWEKIIGGE